MYKVVVDIQLQNYGTLTYDDDIIRVECSTNSRDGSLSLQPGVIEQSASVEIYDRNDVFKNLTMDNQEDVFYGASVIISWIDAQNNSQLVGTYIVKDVELSGDSNIVKIICTDETYKLSNIKVNFYPITTATIHETLTMLFRDYMNMEYGEWAYEDANVEGFCRYALLRDYYINNNDARQVLEELCIVGCLHIYLNKGIYMVGMCL